MDKKILQTPYGEICYCITKKPQNKHTYLRVKEDYVDIKTNRYTTQRFVTQLLLKNAKTITARLQIKKGYFLFGKAVEKPVDVAKFYKQKAQEYLPKRVHALAKQTRLQPTAIKITQAKTRWGSCSHKNSINLSCFLLKLPHEVIDYVIIHELCHIVHKNHKREFWQEVAKHCKSYKKMVAVLREYEQKAY
ncbi:MAG: M48 family metallopeptidase [Campylobacterota bacterium]